MTLFLDVPEARSSPLQRLDPRWKLAATLIAAGAVIGLRTPLPALTAVAGAALLVVLARLPARWFLARLGAGLLLLLFFVLWLPFVVHPGDSTVEVLGLPISLTGIDRALVLLAKAASVIALILILLTTAPLHATFKAAQRLGAPGWLVQIVLMSYRYVHLLGEEFGRLRIALRVRGYRNRPRLHSYRTIGHVAGTLLVRGHERSERVAQAMRCRGFDGQFRSLHDFHTRPADALFVAAVVFVAVALVVWDVVLASRAA
jgi:cobalt/nickel transport system permease protein